MKIAFITKQNKTTTVVHCPYCSKSHIHGKVNHPETRSSHCFKGEYVIQTK